LLLTKQLTIIKPTKLKQTEFPGVQRAADKASNQAQKFYMNMVKTNLISGVLAALLTIFNFESEEPKVYIYAISLVLMIVGLGLTVAIKYYKFEDLWYQGRALAESVKTLTWRYITCSENYEASLPQNEADHSFTDSLQNLQNKFPDLVNFMDSNLLNTPVISNEMKKVRNLSWDLRLARYIECRIDDQISWYSAKTLFNKGKKKFWLYIVIACQSMSIIACISLLLCASGSWNFIGLFTTLAASAIAWLEVRQYQSLIQAYNTATMELVIIKALANSINTEESFTSYVLDSENAISREHTMWLAQRRK